MSLWDSFKGLSGFNMVNSFLNPQNGYKDAQKETQKGWNQAQDYQKPYWQHGLDQYGNLNNAENSLMNPGELESKWSSGYETSPYAKDMLERNKNAGLDAASSMGLNGSSAALGNIQTGAGQIVNQDRQQYMNDLMQKYMQGIGIGQNIYGQGAATGGNLGNQAFNQGQNMAGLKYNETNAPGDMFGKLLGTGASLAGNYMTGGMYGAAKGAMNGGGNNNQPFYAGY